MAMRLYKAMQEIRRTVYFLAEEGKERAAAERACKDAEMDGSELYEDSIDVEPVAPGGRPEGRPEEGWDEDCLVYGAYDEDMDVTLGLALREFTGAAPEE